MLSGQPSHFWRVVGYQSVFSHPCAIIFTIEGGNRFDFKYVYYINAYYFCGYRKYEIIEILLAQKLANANGQRGDLARWQSPFRSKQNVAWRIRDDYL